MDINDIDEHKIYVLQFFPFNQGYNYLFCNY